MPTVRKTARVVGVAAACAVAAGALYGTGAASADRPTAHTTAEPQNIGLLKKQIESYYGAHKDADGTWRASADSAYADDLARIEAGAKKDIDKAARKARHHGEKPAVVFDIDDTLLLSLDYEISHNYGYDSASWGAYVAKADRPAVFGTPDLVRYAAAKGVEVFYNSGLSEDQRSAAMENLKKIGVDVNLDADHVFLKDKADPPAYLSDCATAAAWNCTTVQYKAGTRKHIESLGYDIVGDFGDQYTDLQGGYADKTYKLPNPTYYVG
ncbi:HAD family acid phosphatase [Streptomyces beihaiensis]|uniref:Secreted acid phosphatase n=1 Tax=Streptomyces beihaiensis TaxID=2984495 RepID=A0ABT3TPL2_9ACTN|nr:HAD family acid phosphatase [Streptomyces beihaiensis]MCX3058972.1 Secreted acid phosphatase [Streptomyces beihaiensis]